MNKIRVLVVEDSRLFQELLVSNLNENPDIEVVATAMDPYEAKEKLEQFHPDVMTLDIELPRMNGIDFLQTLMPEYPIPTVVVSTLSDKVFDAIKAGAVDFAAKPLTSDRNRVEEFTRVEIPQKVRIAATASLKKKKLVQNVSNSMDMSAVKRHNIPARDDMLIAIGASTGGTEATVAVLKEFGDDLPGIVITQHMPAGFTAMYAERLDQRAGLKLHVREAKSGDIVKPGEALLAPGGECHMKVERKYGRYQIVLEDAPRVNGHRPSVDVLFHSVAEAAGANSVGIILTGMGGDGAKGLLAMRGAGARTIGQDKDSCVVYGMPKVAYELGAVEYQETLADIGKRTYELVEQIQKQKR